MTVGGHSATLGLSQHSNENIIYFLCHGSQDSAGELTCELLLCCASICSSSHYFYYLI